MDVSEEFTDKFVNFGLDHDDGFIAVETLYELWINSLDGHKNWGHN